MTQNFFDVRTDRNRIEIFGDLRLGTLDLLDAAIHSVAIGSRYPDITLDFSSISSITSSVAPPLAAYLRYLTQQHKIDYTYIQPKSLALRNRMTEIGLAHYISYRKFENPRINSSGPVVMQFYNLNDCVAVTDKIINNVLRTIKIDRSHMAALEWAISEITDNVLNHSKSPVGGFAIYNRVPRTNIVEFTVADCGVGIAQSLGIRDEREAVEQAIREGVTRNKQTNQGNGLYGTFRLACTSKTLFSIRSRHGALYVDREGSVKTRLNHIPYQGTIVTCQIDCDYPDLIKKAFVFGGKIMNPALTTLKRYMKITISSQ